MRISATSTWIVASLVLTACGVAVPTDEQSPPVPPIQADHGPCVPVLDPDTQEGCPPENPDLSPGGDGLFVGWTEEDCRNGVALWFWDQDGDQVHDFCEYDLAEAFRPALSAPSDCNWDPARGGPGGEYLYALRALGRVGDGMRIFYMPAYYFDCGSGWTPWPLTDNHSGDSEFIILDIAFNELTNHWYPTRMFLSAHCGKYGFDDHCRWWTPVHFEWVGNHLGGAPIVYVSLGKHAHFPNVFECGQYDSCSAHGDGFRFGDPWFNGQYANVGSRDSMFINVTGPLSSSAFPDPGQTEEIWDTDDDWVHFEWVCGPYHSYCFNQTTRFNGWQSGAWGDPPPGYGTVLAFYGGF